MTDKNQQTVYVAMSGGVDSSLTAALIKEQGYKTVGVYMKNWTADIAGFECPWRQDLTDAQSVAAKLQIPLKIYDFQTEYKHKVVDYMVSEFRAGKVPNPDIMCNQEIKFRLFLDTALNDGAEQIATGHYAQIKNNKLQMARDEAKDQTYFLYRMPKLALGKTLLPIGGYQKSEVRALARKFGLPTANKPDSMGICFIGQVDFKQFLKEFIEVKPGAIIMKSTGAEIGQHEGAIFYSLGQRHGLGIGGGKPLYVIGKDVKRNLVYVSDNPGELELYGREIFIEQPHWLGPPPSQSKKYQVRIRHTGKLTNCTLHKDRSWKIKLENPERAITSGQSAVVYNNRQVIGGGVIAGYATNH